MASVCMCAYNDHKSCVFQLGDPTIEDHISSQYSSLDFDGISEYTQFFSSIMLFQCMCMVVIFSILLFRVPWMHDSYHPAAKSNDATNSC